MLTLNGLIEIHQLNICHQHKDDDSTLRMSLSLFWDCLNKLNQIPRCLMYSVSASNNKSIKLLSSFPNYASKGIYDVDVNPNICINN